jgi:FdhE protein
LNAPNALDTLKRSRPEWSPWLAVVEEALAEAAGSRWDALVPAMPVPERATPVLSHSTIVIDESAVRGLLNRLVKIAARGGMPKLETLTGITERDIDLAGLFAASVCQDRARISEVAASAGAEPDALHAVAGLVSLPFLQACNRQWRNALPKNWAEGFCLLCGTWPALAETRGIERDRYLRCGRCGGEWQAHILRCGYCGTNDHEQLATLVPEKAGAAVVEACKRCHGYVKTFTRLQGCPPAAVMLEDLASVDLDVAALAQGYRRPAGGGADVEVAVVATAPRFLSWNM